MDYLAIDVETSNADYSSICQIGIVEIQNGKLTDQWSTLVNPEAYFDPFNISIHGITENDVENAPTFDAVYSELKNKIAGRITVHHMPFDKIAINRACSEYDLEFLQVVWLDSAKIVRRTWDEFAYRGYGLANIAQYLNIEFEHHDALEDAKAAAQIVRHASEKTGLTIDDWLTRIKKPISDDYNSSSISLEGNPEGSLYGENLVFTGSLFLPRKDAAKIAADLGCNVKSSVSKKTTLLVVGTQDTSKLAGYHKSSKHRKAEKLIENGTPIQILSEKDFVEMCKNENADLQLSVPKPTVNTNKNEKENSVTFELKIQDLDSNEFDELNDFWENLTEEQKGAIEKSNQKYQKVIESIKKCSHAEKREFAKEFKLQLLNINHQWEQIENKSFDDDDSYVLDTIDMERNEIQDDLFELMKNKITLAEFFEVVKISIENIEDDLEEYSISKSVKNYAEKTLNELKTIESNILSA
jgi:DNA polymerase-3 subunit epsilon